MKCATTGPPMREKLFYVYILASKSGTLYIGITNDLARRVYEHREGLVEGFTKKYECKKLVYYERHATALEAIAREKRLKGWLRSRKEDLIREMNPRWEDLYDKIV